MAKRKSTLAAEPAAATAPRRSLRNQKSGVGVKAAAAAPTPSTPNAVSRPKDTEPPAKKSRLTKQPATAKTAAVVDNAAASTTAKPQENGIDVAPDLGTAAGEDGERNYWLLKAEPESRFENGVDVRFSIDDLAAKTEPEPWDGIRAYAARNNLRAMKQGDLAFFYHSNCKEPGIVGTMEIVQEHSPDLSAHDPNAPYYDPKSKPSDPKWSVVHVKFRSKFAAQIGLKELREMGGPGRPLENMQMLKQSRLSVSKVNAAEWEYLSGVAEARASEK